ncbi:hypothetical protein PAXRUDRAFT_33411 [Paxillus rubicundulus Ve08.2h10]|uniref:Uncharacterized protein n=1 Tax=Paxillus rubicundulus Ve08.2h10 TaxID=930991 RepID=A0A0D0E294_9AGAM|nr:hypothetical protein PAXRUDRAFT_33411 [Paxillus rubicundulus Ve08.2h10]
MIHPSYSPLFTLGLLAERCTSSSSSNPASSSPLDATASASNLSQKSPASDDASAFYFTLQTSNRDTLELRSFLYLDLAEYNKPVAGHRRKPSIMSKSTSWTATTDLHSTHDLSRHAKHMIMTAVPPIPFVPVRRRSSKESLRNIPSPKPAPSTMLPDLPNASNSRHPSATLPSPVNTEFSSRTMASRPAPSIPRPMLSPTAFSGKPSSLRSESVSSHVRRKSRMHALACLEGRSRASNRIPRAGSRANFMSFSDDEDDNCTPKSKAPTKASRVPQIHVEDMSGLADVEDEADAIMPALSRKRGPAKPAKPTRPTRKRRSTIHTWFPLRSFIDFKDDDLSAWNWRSFIEIGGVSL